MEPSFRGRKSFPTQNVMEAVDFDLRFTYVLAGWEGTTHDVTVLADALERENGLYVAQGKFYLVDVGYGAKPGFLPPFCAVRYHLNEWGSNPVQNEKELLNLRHSSLRVTIERAFGTLKRRFKILDDATQFFPFPVQVDIVVACLDKFNVRHDGITAAQVSNHLKKWRRIWINITKLRNLSAALWDEDTSTILLDPEHYANHIKDHKSDANYLNTPIEHYNAMATIFGASMATGKFAKSANDPLSVEVHDVEDEDTQ